ncbi:Hypothetical_protein [Hexamita inflata]|uniref:Hypothetical_protein n=1 Tax=Hexamita inflata TaxID=28002 RepID=A0AA86TRG7_9EUKA|nr:Hypothetical protein HINF_LOCUS7788 [Hexamita inflata]
MPPNESNSNKKKSHAVNQSYHKKKQKSDKRPQTQIKTYTKPNPTYMNVNKHIKCNKLPANSCNKLKWNNKHKWYISNKNTKQDLKRNKYSCNSSRTSSTNFDTTESPGKLNVPQEPPTPTEPKKKAPNQPNSSFLDIIAETKPVLPKDHKNKQKDYKKQRLLTQIDRNLEIITWDAQTKELQKLANKHKQDFGELHKFKCPICNFSFKTLLEIMTHFNIYYKSHDIHTILTQNVKIGHQQSIQSKKRSKKTKSRMYLLQQTSTIIQGTQRSH